MINAIISSRIENIAPFQEKVKNIIENRNKSIYKEFKVNVLVKVFLKDILLMK